jgi:hypothetical protein
MGKLSAADRRALPGKDFALPGRRYPVEDKGHARAALSRVAANGSPVEKAAVRRKVAAKYPDMEMAHPVGDLMHPKSRRAHP